MFVWKLKGTYSSTDNYTVSYYIDIIIYTNMVIYDAVEISLECTVPCIYVCRLTSIVITTYWYIPS